MSEVKAAWTNEDNFSIETTASDYIKREDAEKLLRYNFLGALTEDERVNELNRIPSADVVEVVRCKDCKYNSCSPDSGNACCDTFYGMTDQMGFCSYGERKEQKHESNS